MRNFYPNSILAICLILTSFGLSAQTVTIVNSSFSPLINIGGSNYQGYCVEYNNSIPSAGETYHWDATHEDINLFGVTACLQGHSTYGTNAVQKAIWYFTDSVNPPTGDAAWTIISNVENGVYVEQCCSEWYPKTNGRQDMCTHNDPYCKAVCDATNFDPGSLNGGVQNCGPFDPPSVPTNSTPASGCQGGQTNYQWQRKDASTNWQWQNISGATSEFYNPGWTTVSTWIRRGAVCDPCGDFEYTNVIDIHVVPNYNNAGVINGDQCNCGKFDPSNITSHTDPSPYYDFYDDLNQIKWEQRTVGGSWNLISGATDLEYNPGPITETMEYRRCGRVNPCTEWICTDVVVKAILETPDPTNDHVTVCPGGNVNIDVSTNDKNVDNNSHYSVSSGGGSFSGSNYSTTAGNSCGTHTVTYEVCNTSNNCSSNCCSTATINISIEDNHNPTLVGVPADVTAECNNIPNAPNVTGDDNCDGNVHVGFHEDSTKTNNGTCSDNEYSITRTWTATDDCGNTHVDHQTITVVDTTDPVVTCNPDNGDLECVWGQINNLGTVWNNANITKLEGCSSDACGSVTVTSDYSYNNITNDCGDTGTTLVTYTIEDKCGNTITKQATLTFTDTTPPMIPCDPDNETHECTGATGNEAAANTWNAANIAEIEACGKDDCGDRTTVTSNYNYNLLSDGCGTTGSITVEYTLTDDCGLSTSKSATFTVVDTTKPVVLCSPSDETFECSGTGTNQDAADAWNASNIQDLEGCSSDACSNVTVTSNYSFSNLNGNCGGVGTIDVAYIIEDECGNSVKRDATFTIVDTTDPSVGCNPDDEIFECDGIGSNQAAANSWNDSNIANLVACSTDACGTITVTSDYSFSTLTNGCGDTGVITVNYTIQDDCGFSVVKTATFTIEDNTSPTINNQASDLTVECDGSGNTAQLNNWLDNQGGASSSDVCGSVEWTNNYSSLSNDCAATGTATVVFTATDDCGNVNTTSADFTIEDTTNPTINNSPDNLTLECDGSGNTLEIQNWLAANGNGSASDVCGDFDWSNDYNNLSNDCGETGTTSVIFTVTDDCGNSTTASATITIEDTTNPNIDIQAQDETVECDGAGNQTALNAWLTSNGGASSSDVCGIISWSNDFDQLSNECGANGSATVVFTAMDDCGNMSSTSATFTIEDNTDPTISTASDQTVECNGSGNLTELQSWLDLNGGANSSDVCGAVTWSYETTTQTDECGETGEVIATFTATDDCGNTSSTSASFIIEDTTSPSIDAAASNETVECDGSGNQAQLNAWLISNGGAESSDICGSMTWDNNFPGLSDDCAETGSTTVVFTVTDDCGNTSTTSAIFTIEDTTPPTPVVQDITIQLDGSCMANITPEDIDNGSFDECGDIANIELDIDSFNCAEDEGNNTVILTVTDECGNSATATANVRVERFDLALRTILAPGEDERVYPGEDITFKIEVHNQGSLAASNIQIVDYIPTGLTLNDSDWSGGGTTANITLPGTLAPGEMTMVEITFNVVSTSQGQIINEAEISSANAPSGFDSTDVDSTADTNQTNDGGGQVNSTDDDNINEGCCSGGGNDEDDADPEDITVEVFDLALIKVMAAGQDTRVYPGEDVTFTIQVFNQGTVPASNIVVTDYIPTGLSLNDGAWAEAGSSASTTLPGTLAPGASTTVDITFTVDATNVATNIINRAEISGSVDDLGNDAPDLDSVEDTNQGNDAGGVVNSGSDDQTDGNGTNDEDDADPEDINVEIFDLALRKTLAAGEDARVYPGQDITFTIEIFNQGTVPASNVVVEDFAPAGLTPQGSTTLNIPGPIAPGNSATVDITFTVDANASAGFADNIAEIQSSQDDLGDSPNDNDSNEDNNPNNDPTTDNEINNGSGDEDDNDLETVDIQIFDLALIKVLAAGEDDRVYPGETVTFTIEVFNQGTISASNISIEDYAPAGLTPNGSTSLNIAGPIAPGSSATVDISFTVDATLTGGQIINEAEISGAEDDLGDSTVPDIDSVSDTNQTNDAGGVVNSGSDDQTDGNGTNDEDDADPEDVFVEIFDLALRKTLAAGEDATVYPGETVSFTIEVFNQGTVPASNINITDYQPTGLTAVGSTNLNIPGPIAPGASATVDISFTVDAANSAATLENGAEISSAEDDLGDNPEDNDSTPDTDSSNDPTTDNEINNGSGDEDDDDIEPVELQIFDLALVKDLAAGEDARIYPGEDVTFTLTITNEGTVDAYNIEVTDYLPSCLNLNDGAWTMSGGFAVTNIVGPLAPGASTTVDITVTATEACVGQTVDNVAEISNAEDENGDNPDDNDSSLDNDPNNPDEDDSDNEPLDPQLFDLALIKVLSAGEDDRVYPGETVSFTIEVFNQGTVPASNINIEDYAPTGLTPTGSTSLNIAGPIAPGSSATVDISFVVSTTSSGQIINEAEINSAEDDLGENPQDIDSTPDQNQGNDAGGVVNTGSDDQTDGNGTDDEDDADPEDVFVEVFDLASNITLAPGEDDRVYPGETVSFKVTVFNQGTVPGENVEVTLMIPAELIPQTGGITTPMGTITFPGPIAPGGMEMQIIEFLVDGNATSASELIIKEEISNYTDDLGETPEDIDSTPDADFTNDAGGVVDTATDDEVNDDGTIDEDDEDPENVFLEIYDLALRKTLAAGEDATVYPGETVSFTIEIFNQGTVPASNIVIEDYVPAGLTPIGSTTLNIAGPIAPGSSETVDIDFTVDAANSAATLVNGAEIQSSQDDLGENPDDIDSTEDGDSGNDQTTDNEIDNAGGDEDDDDIEPIELEIFDLALRKTLSPGEDNRVYPGETVSFDIEVFNQGTVAAYNIIVEDYVPSGLSANGATSITIPGPIAPGGSEIVSVSFTVSTTSAGSLENGAEIQSAEDINGDNPTDNDSVADGNPNNDITTDNEIDNANDDEDDADIEELIVEVFDLASNITLAPGEDDRVYPGETVSFKVTVFNQGTVPGENVEVTLMIPAELIPQTGGITTPMGTITFPGPIAPGGMEMQIIEFLVDENATSASELIIKEEISNYTDDLGDTPEDIDSTPDADFTNDAGGVVDTATDDEVNDDGTIDEDDEDPENVFMEIYDLALRKTLSAGEDATVYPGETIGFTIEIFNQGTVPASNIVIEDYVPAGLTPTGSTTLTIAGPIAPGSSTSINISFTVDAANAAATLVNGAEIQSSQDDLGENPDDIDSTEDGDSGNDPTTDNEINNGSGDEDDDDIEPIELEIFDLALRKTTSQTGVVKPGDDVTFTIEIFNQGSVTAQNVEVVDYLPEFFNLSPNDTNGWTNAGSNIANTLSGPIASGASVTVEVVLQVQSGIMSGSYDNFAEITSAEDENGDNPNDNDSTPNDTNGDDQLVDNEINDNGTTDEDDHDVEPIEVCDDVAPELVGIPQDITIECNETVPTPPVIGVEITATDFSNDEYTITLEETTTQGDGDDCSEFDYTITRIWTVTDVCDNSSSATQIITVGDNTAPVIDVEAMDEVVECNGSGNQIALQNWLDANGGSIATDNCSDVVWENDFNELTDQCGETGTVTVVFTVTDDCGNTNTTSANFTIEDNTAPVIDIQAADETVECDGLGNQADLNAWLINNAGATASDVCSATNVTWTNDYTELSNECGATGSTPVIFTVTDDCGNTATTTAIFTIEDTISPNIDTPAIDEIAECDGFGNQNALDSWLAANGGADASDACGDVVWTNNFVEFTDDCGSTGSATVTFTATDECGNTSETTAIFTIEDNTAPIIDLDAQNQTVECDGLGNQSELDTWLTSNGGAEASDPCGEVSWTNDYSSLSDECGATGSTTVAFVATDECGNTSETIATFTIEDTTSPEVTVVAEDATVECDGSGNQTELDAWLASNGGAAASDACGSVSWTNDVTPLTDECGATGSVTVTYTATDECGNTSQTSATFTIEDTTSPSIDTPSADATVECGVDNQSALDAWLANNGGAAASDVCGLVEWSNDFEGLSDDCGSTGTATVTFVATDECGNTSETVASFTIEDTISPSIDTPASDELAECDGSGNANALDAWLADNGGAEASDACGSVEWTNDFAGLSDECGSTGTATVTFTATDECGNTSETTASFTIEDNTAPEISPVAENVEVECDGSGNQTELDAWLASNGGAAASDACGEVSWTNDFTALSDECGATGTSTVVFTATDECGNASTTEASFTILDTTVPTITVEALDTTVECDGSGNQSELDAWLASNGGADATDECSGVTWENDYSDNLSDDCGATGSVTVTFTARDECDNVNATIATFTIEDTTSPEVTVVAEDATVECDGSGNQTELDAWLASNGGAAASDACGSVSWTNDVTPLTDECGATGSVTVTYTATDECGNTSQTSATFSIEDTTAPSIDAEAADETVECDGLGNQADIIAWLESNAGATAADICSGISVTWTNDFDQVSDECGATGLTPVIFTATDDCGNTATTTAIFTIEDTASPSIDTPAIDEIAECDGFGNQNALDSWLAANGGADASDACGDVVWTNNFVEFTDDCGSTGSATVTFTATDECGNTSETTALFTIEDNTAPIIDLDAQNQTVECDGLGNQSELDAWLTSNGGAEASDPCGEVSWTNDYSSLSDECGATGSTTVAFVATDECGNTSETIATFTIEDTTSPEVTVVAEDATVECDGSGNQTELDAWLASNGGAAASDACGSVSWTNDVTPLTDECGATGSVTVTYTATDECGNTSQTSATFTIEDTTSPSIDTPSADATVECGVDNQSALDAWLANNGGAAASDVCGLVEWSNDYTGLSDDCGSTGIATVTFVATDECGNTSETVASFTIEDTISPSIDTPASDELAECDGSGNANALDAWLADNGGAEASDACGSVEWTNDFAGLSDECGSTGTATVTFTATDECGNTSETTASFTIEDNTAPEISPVAENVEVECDGSGNQTELDAWLASNGGAAASDACGEVSWTNDFTALSDECGATGTSTVVFTATDECGNASTTEASFTILDTTVPTITVEAGDTTVECDGSGNQSELDAWLASNGGADATDECSGVTWENDYSDNLSDDCGATGSVTVTFTARDECDNVNATIATFTIEDTTSPEVTVVAEDATVECDGSGNQTELDAWLASNGGAAASDACGSVSWTNDVTPLTDECGATGSVTVTYTATDECGNTSQTSATFTIEDTTSPSIDTPSADATVECGADSQAALDAWVSSNGGAAASDACGSVEWTNDYTGLSDDCGSTGTATVTFVATDECGNTSETVASFTIEDTISPSIDTPASDELAECDGSGNANALDAWLADNGGAEASDACGSVEWTNDFAGLSDECGSTGTATVTFTATDECGNTSETTASFTIEDNTAPEISPVAENVEVECDGSGNQTELDAWLASNGGAAASDACGEVSWTNDFTALSDECGATGTSTVVFTATDECGNASTTEASFTILDTTVPTITVEAGDTTVECDGSGNQSELDAWLASNGGADATDECSGVTWENDYSDNLSDDCGATGSVTVTFTARDECDNVNATIATFTIEDTTSPEVTVVAEDATVECDGSGNQTELDAWLASNGGAAASDACGSVSWTNDVTPLTDECGATGSVTVTYTATDECGNTSQTSATFTIEDTTSPSIDTPSADATVECGADSQAALDAWVSSNGGAAASDACGSVEWTNDYTGLSDDCGSTGIATVTFVATDECGNTSETVASFTIEDTISPSIDTPASDELAECDGSGNANALDAWLADNGGAEASDACGSVEWTNDFAGLSDECGSTGTATVTFTATDECGNTSETTASFTIEDNTAPEISPVAENVEVECDGSGNQTELDAWLASNGGAAASDACGEVSWTNDFTALSDECGATGTSTVVFTATDECGNASTTEASFTILDTTVPTITVEAGDTTVECDGSGNQSELDAWLASNGGADATDECSGVTWENDYSDNLSDDCGATGSVTVTFTARDECDNVNATIATFTIEDTTSPEVTVVAEDATVECDGSGNQTELDAWLASNGGAAASDACGSVSWTNDVTPLTDECGATGSVTVTYTATDECGNTSQTSATFTIEDTTSPSIDTPSADATVECGADSQAALDAWVSSNGGAAASDACGSVSWTNDYTGLSDDCGSTGTATVTFVATDECGNTSETVASFTIEDTISPSIDTPASDELAECDGAGNANALDVWLADNGGAEASDACGSVEWTNDFAGLSDECGSTGTATVTFTATDECGNTSETTASFTIEDNTAPEISPVAENVEVECDGSGNQTELDAWLASNGGAAASDACGEVSWTNDFTALSDECGATGTSTVVFTATDECGNASTTEASFTILDTTVPTITVEAGDTTVECDGSGNQSELDAWLASNGGANATDICSGVTWENDYSDNLSDDCGATGSVTVTFTARDECDNVNATIATFTIEDTTSPEVTVVAEDATVECDGSGNQTELDAWLASNGGAAASDACGSVSWTNDVTPLTDECGATGSVTVTYTATDECGNTSQTSATFTIEDTTSPSIDTPSADATVECGADSQAALDAWVSSNGGAAASDACGSVSWTNDYTGLSDDCGLTGTATVTFVATDECGNTSETVASFTIEDTISPSIDTPASDELAECDGAGNANALDVWLADNGGAEASDACGSVEWTNDFAGLSDECGSTGTATVTFTATGRMWKYVRNDSKLYNRR